MTTTAPDQPRVVEVRYCGRCKAHENHGVLPGTARMVQCAGCGFISGPITDDADVEIQIPRQRLADVLHEVVQIPQWRVLLDALDAAWDEREALDGQSCRPGEREHLEAELDQDIIEVEKAIIDQLGDHYVNLSRSPRLRLIHGGEPS